MAVIFSQTPAVLFFLRDTQKLLAHNVAPFVSLIFAFYPLFLLLRRRYGNLCAHHSLTRPAFSILSPPFPLAPSAAPARNFLQPLLNLHWPPAHLSLLIKEAATDSGYLLWGWDRGDTLQIIKCRDAQRSDKQFATGLGYPWCILLPWVPLSTGGEWLLRLQRDGRKVWWIMWLERGRGSKEEWDRNPASILSWSGLRFFPPSTCCAPLLGSPSLTGLIHRMKSCSVWCIIYQRQGISNLCSRAQITDR